MSDEEERYVYKVVRKTGSTLHSCVAEKQACLTYRIGEWVSAPDWLRRHGYHPTAFTGKLDAKYFCSAVFNNRIFLAKANGVCGWDELPPPLHVFKLDRGEILPVDNDDMDMLLDFPTGTVMCEEIKLVEDVTEEVTGI